MFLQACPRALSRISNNLKDFRTDMRMSVIMCLSEHFPRVPRCYLSNAADWQAHFLGLRVQKTISCLTLITSQTPPANSARLLRVIGFSHLLSKRRRMSLLPCGPLSWDWDPQSCRFCAAQPRSWHAGGGRGPGPWQPTPSRKLSILQRGENRIHRSYSTLPVNSELTHGWCVRVCGDYLSSLFLLFLFLSDRISCSLDWPETSYIAVGDFELKLHLFINFCGG